MMVLVVSACPAGLRGDLTKWLMEISAGVFVGRPSARIRDLLWERTVELCGHGRAILVYNAANEQGIDFRVHNHDWIPTDFDGIQLMVRPMARKKPVRKTGWSNARNIKRARGQ